MAKIPVSFVERSIILGIMIAMVVLCAVFLVIFEIETVRLNDYSQKHSVAIDVVRQGLPGLHLMTVPIFVALLFARKYIVSFILTLSYGALMVNSYFLRLDGTGYFGGEGFYDNRPFAEVINKSHGFEFAVAVFIPVLLIWHVSLFMRGRSVETNRQLRQQ